MNYHYYGQAIIMLDEIGVNVTLLVHLELFPQICFFTNRKQRKRLHDRLRQSVRNKRNNNTNAVTGPNLASSARGRQISNLPLQDLQLINVCCYSLVSNKRHQNLLNL